MFCFVWVQLNRFFPEFVLVGGDLWSLSRYLIPALPPSHLPIMSVAVGQHQGLNPTQLRSSTPRVYQHTTLFYY